MRRLLLFASALFLVGILTGCNQTVWINYGDNAPNLDGTDTLNVHHIPSRAVCDQWGGSFRSALHAGHYDCLNVDF